MTWTGDVDWREFRAGVRLTRETIGQQALNEFRGREIKPGAMLRSEAGIDAFARAHAKTALHRPMPGPVRGHAEAMSRQCRPRA